MSSPTWDSDDHPTEARIGPIGWLRAIARGLPLAVLVFGGLLVLLCVRLLERPIHRQHRPWTPHITVFVCRYALRLLGLSFTLRGRPMLKPGGLVANHTSWLDIFSLNAIQPLYFVSKSEVAGWPGIGWLARATGTVFIRRNTHQARAHMELLQARIGVGHKLLFFPEGTSSDGLQVLPFKSSLFAAFLQDEIRTHHTIQAISLVYHAPRGADRRFYGWWGDMGFGPHLLSTLAARRQGGVEVICHPPVNLSEFSNRKALAQHLEQQVRQGHSAALPQ